MKGISILEKNQIHYERNFNNHFFYNLANAKLSIANDFGYKNDLLSYEDSKLYSEAKNLYWQVFKTIDKDEEPSLYGNPPINNRS
ncbi:hypothetical protein AB2762_14025 [Acinetobacter indicus]